MSATDAQDVVPGEQAEASVGVLGWLGFVIINIAAWGIITVSSSVLWVMGFLLSVSYCAGLIGLAIFLGRKGEVKYRQFMNLLWVLGCTFVFVSGMFIVVNVIKGDDAQIPVPSPSPSEDVKSLDQFLPSNASSALKTWASNSWYKKADSLAQITVNGTFYFVGRQRENERERLFFATAGAAVEVPQSESASDLTEFQSELVFVGRLNNEDRVMRVGANSSGTVELVTARSVRSLFIDGNILYAKASIACSQVIEDCWRDVRTIFRSDGIVNNTADLRNSSGTCADLCGGTSSGTSSNPSSNGPPRAQLWGTLFLALLPMMALGGFVLVAKKMPGTFLNLYGGFVGVVVVLYLQVNSSIGGNDFFIFMKWFLTIYTSLLWVVLVAWSLAREDMDMAEWLRDLKTWAVAVVGVSFFVVIHVDLEIPVNQEGWRWVVYFLVVCLQLVLSAVVSRTVPLVAGALGLFVLAFKIAYELVEFADFGRSEFKMLAMLAIIALQGIGIIVGAIVYAGFRKRVEDMLKAFLRCNKQEMARLYNGETMEVIV